MIEQKIYVATDGRTFKDSNDCLLYEYRELIPWKEFEESGIRLVSFCEENTVDKVIPLQFFPNYKSFFSYLYTQLDNGYDLFIPNLDALHKLKSVLNNSMLIHYLKVGLITKTDEDDIKLVDEIIDERLQEKAELDTVINNLNLQLENTMKYISGINKE